MKSNWDLFRVMTELLLRLIKRFNQIKQNGKIIIFIILFSLLISDS